MEKHRERILWLDQRTGRPEREGGSRPLQGHPQEHREAAAKSARASGVDEEVTELSAALDAAVELDDSLLKAAEEGSKKKQEQVCPNFSFDVAI